MLYVQEDREGVAHLEICRDVLLEEGVFFTDGNCARWKEIKRYYCLEDLARLNWKIIRTRNCYSDEYRLRKAAEVLVPSPVSPDKVQAVYVKTRSKLREVEASMKSSKRQLKIVVNTDLYEF